VLTSQGRRPKQPLVFCPWIAQWMLLLIAPPPLAPSLGSSTQRERVCGGTKSCKTGGGFGSACMCCHRHPLSSPDHLRNSMFLITLCFWDNRLARQPAAIYIMAEIIALIESPGFTQTVRSPGFLPYNETTKFCCKRF